MNIVEFFVEKLGVQVTDYSGRGMSGDRTLGIILDNATDIGNIIVGVMEHAADMDETLQLRIRNWCQHLRWDTFGLGTVFYSNWFPMTDEEKESLESYEDSQGEYED